jgi:N-sulfoglucosamine sulfohydrolase
MKKPNVIYFHSHDTGRYVSPYGYDVPTPNFQRLAEEGVVFRKAFCVAPTCSPSRAGLFTGTMPHENGMLGLAHRGWSLNDYSQTLVQLFNDAGYKTVLCGHQHVVVHDRTSELKFSEVLTDNPIPEAAESTRLAAEFIRNRTDDHPFYLDVGCFETHFCPTKGRGAVAHFHPDGPQGDGRYVSPPSPIPDCEATRADWADFREAARRLDDGLGTILDALEEAGLLDETLVFHTTDHGLPFPNMKSTLHDGGTGVSLIMRGPGGFRGGQVLDALVSHLDILPTLQDLCSLPDPAWKTHGTSILPLVNGSATSIHDAVFSETNFHGDNSVDDAQRSIRTGRFKLIRRFTGPNHPVPAYCDNSQTKELMMEAGWADWDVPPVRLYDLVLDPGEAHNLAESNAHRPILEDLSSRLDAWMKTTADPKA